MHTQSDDKSDRSRNKRLTSTILNKYDDTGTTELVELVNLVTTKVFENCVSEWFCGPWKWFNKP